MTSGVYNSSRTGLSGNPVDERYNLGLWFRSLRGDQIIANIRRYSYFERIDQKPGNNKTGQDGLAAENDALASDGGLQRKIIVTEMQTPAKRNMIRTSLVEP